MPTNKPSRPLITRVVQHPVPEDFALSGDTRNRLHVAKLPRRDSAAKSNHPFRSSTTETQSPPKRRAANHDSHYLEPLSSYERRKRRPRVGVSDDFVRKLLRERKIVGSKIGACILVHRASVEALLQLHCI